MTLRAPGIHIIVEDDGLKYLLDECLHLTALPSNTVNIIAGGGWPNVSKAYNGLVSKGVETGAILPIIDGDLAHGKNPPETNDIFRNSNLKRLYKDLEYAFDNWMIAEAMISLECYPFAGDQSPKTFLEWQKLIIAARRTSAKNAIPFYDALQEKCKDHFAENGGDRTAFVLPGKVKFAKAVSAIIARSRIFSEQLEPIIQHIQQVAEKNGIQLPRTQKAEYLQISSETRLDSRISGKVLLSMGGQLWVLDLHKHAVYRFDSANSWRTHKVCWSPDGNLVAIDVYPAEDKGKSGILITDGNGKEVDFLSRNISMGSESEPCWFKDDKAILIKTENGLCRKNIQSFNWPLVLETQTGTTANHCVSIKGRIAVNVYDRPTGNYFLQIGEADANGPYKKVPNISDTRAGAAWSSDGRYVAFVNHTDSERGAVCIYDNGKNRTYFITSHDGFPSYVCFSPDDKFILYTWRQAKGPQRQLRLVDVETRNILVVIPEIPEMIIGCHAWKN